MELDDIHYSTGALGGTINRKMAVIREKLRWGAFHSTPSVFKNAGDVGLILLAVAWLAGDVYGLFKKDAGGEDGENTEEMADAGDGEEKKEENDEEKAAEEAFNKTVWPAFQKRCIECHTGDTAKGKLDLSTRAAMTNSPVYSPQNIQARIKNDADPMPPEGKERMSAEEVEAVDTGVGGGAPIPKGTLAKLSGPLVAIGKSLLLGAGFILIALGLHYIAGVLFNAGESLIRTTPSHLASVHFPRALALVCLIIAVASLVAGIAYGVAAVLEQSWMSALGKPLGGILLFFTFMAIAVPLLNPEMLNVHVSSRNNAGDEAIGFLALVSKTFLKAAPTVYGFAILFCVISTLMVVLAKDTAAGPPNAEPEVDPATLGWTRGFYEKMSTGLGNRVEEIKHWFKASPVEVANKYIPELTTPPADADAENAPARTDVLKLAIKIPLYTFVYFLVFFLIVEVLRSLMNFASRRP